jgi:hypothetical protein
MRARQIASLLLTAAGCLAGHLGQAQQAPIAPLAPVAPVVAPPVPDLGAKIETKQSAALAPPATTPQQARPVIPEPIIILNGRYLAGMSALGAINPQQIDKIEVYRSGSGPVQWRSLTVPGILSITLKNKPKFKVKVRSLAAIKRRLRLRGPVQFELNGAPIQDESLQIVTEGVAEFDVTHTTSDTAAKTVVNIRLVPYKPAPHNYPPGTIMIRGLAQQ